MALFLMAHTTELAILTLSRHPNLVTDVQATTADVAENAENAENRDALLWARWLALRFPADVQQAAAARRVDLLKAARREGFGTIEQWDKVVYLSRHAAVPRRVAASPSSSPSASSATLPPLSFPTFLSLRSSAASRDFRMML